MKKIFCFILAILFLICIVPFLTGMVIHKMVGCLFLIMIIVHLIIYRANMNWKKWLFFIYLLLVFILGIMAFKNDAMIFNIAHKTTSILLIIFIVIHFYRYHRRIMYENRKGKENCKAYDK